MDLALSTGTGQPFGLRVRLLSGKCFNQIFNAEDMWLDVEAVLQICAAKLDLNPEDQGPPT